MRRGAPMDRTKNRLRSGNERARNIMRNSSKRPPICSLCSLPDHKAGSTSCGVVIEHKASFIKWNSSSAFADKLGNPAMCHVEEASGATKDFLREWLSKDNSIPNTTQHMIVKRCFYAASRKATDSYQCNVLELTLLERGGTVVEGHESCLFPAYKVSSWIRSNCCVNQIANLSCSINFVCFWILVLTADV